MKSPWQEEVIATRAAAIATSILAQHGRSAQLSDFPGLLDGELDAGMTQQAQTLLDVYRLDYWSDVRAKRLQLDLAENLSLRNPSSLDLAQARSATLEAYAAAGAAMAAKFGATPKSLEDLAALAARFSEPQEHSQDIQVSEALIERSHATGVPSPPSHCTETAETGSRTAVADKKHTVASDDSVQAGDDIIAFAEAAASFDVERKNIRASTARQKLQVFALFIAATGKSTFQTLHQTDIKKFVDVMALLPKVRGRSVVDRELGVADLIAKGRTLPKNEVGLTAATVNRNLSYLTKLIRQAGMAGLEGIPDLKIIGFRMKNRVPDEEEGEDQRETSRLF